MVEYWWMKSHHLGAVEAGLQLDTSQKLLPTSGASQFASGFHYGMTHKKLPAARYPAKNDLNSLLVNVDIPIDTKRLVRIKVLI